MQVILINQTFWFSLSCYFYPLSSCNIMNVYSLHLKLLFVTYQLAMNFPVFQSSTWSTSFPISRQQLVTLSSASCHYFLVSLHWNSTQMNLNDNCSIWKSPILLFSSPKIIPTNIVSSVIDWRIPLAFLSQMFLFYLFPQIPLW